MTNKTDRVLQLATEVVRLEEAISSKRAELEGLLGKSAAAAMTAASAKSVEKPKGKPGPKRKAKSGDKPKGKPGPKPKGTASAPAEPKAKGKPGPKPKGKPGPKPKGTTTAAAKAPDVKAKGKPGPKPKGKPGPKPKGKPGPKPKAAAGEKKTLTQELIELLQSSPNESFNARTLSEKLGKVKQMKSIDATLYKLGATGRIFKSEPGHYRAAK